MILGANFVEKTLCCRTTVEFPTKSGLIADLNTQLQLLNFTKGKSEGIIANGNVEGVECQLQSLRSIVTKVEEFKLQIEQTKIAKGETLDDVLQWSL